VRSTDWEGSASHLIHAISRGFLEAFLIMTTQETKKVTKITDKIASKRKAEEQGNWSRLSQDLPEVYKQPVSLREERVWQPSKHRS
jgi:hypothetical protein